MYAAQYLKNENYIKLFWTILLNLFEQQII